MKTVLVAESVEDVFIDVLIRYAHIFVSPSCLALNIDLHWALLHVYKLVYPRTTFPDSKERFQILEITLCEIPVTSTTSACICPPLSPSN